MAIITVTSITCDECGKRAHERDTEGWYYLSVMHQRPPVALLSDPPQYPPDQWQLCSTRCVAAFAAKRGE